MPKYLLAILLAALFVFTSCKSTQSGVNSKAANNNPTVQGGKPEIEEPFTITDSSIKLNPNETINDQFSNGLLPNEFVNGERINHNFKPVYFAYDSSVIRQEEQAKLKMLAGFLESNPSLFLIIEGHCDERGSEEYNRALSERRALAVKEFLESNAATISSRINTIGYGEEKLADPAQTNVAHARNRRAEFIIISKR